MCATGIALVIAPTASCLATFLHEKPRVFNISNSLIEQTLQGVGKTVLYSAPVEVVDVAAPLEEGGGTMS